jgi:hypothetical protein
MMSHQTDYQAVTFGNFDVETADGSRPGEVEGYSIPVIISSSEAATLLAAYDQADSGSPTANTAREIARAVLDALKRYTGS